MIEVLVIAGTGLGVFLFGYGLGLTKRPKGYLDYVRGVKDPTIKTLEVEKRVEVKVYIDQTLGRLSETDRQIEEALRKRISVLLRWFENNPGDPRCPSWINEVRQLQLQADEIRLASVKKVAEARLFQKEIETNEVS